MSFAPDPLQRLLLWRLAVGKKDGEFLKNIEATITPDVRGPLVQHGLIEEEMKKAPDTGRKAIFLELTEKGWAWCQNHLDAEFSFQGRTPKLASVTLNRFLNMMKIFFENQEQIVSFGQFVHLVQANHKIPNEPKEIDSSSENVKNSICTACLELGNDQKNVRVRLSDLRSRLNDIPRDLLDNTLLEMEREGKLSLYPLDNPQEITSEDREAVLRTSTGNERHIIYFGGKGS